MKTILLSSAALVGLVLVGCAKDPDTTVASPKNDTSNNGTSDTTGASLIGNGTAVTRITEARCTREEKCGNIGAGKKYADRAACQGEVSQNTQSDLRASECAGVVPKELDECLDEVKNQACNNPIDAITRVASCTRSQLCP